MLAVRGTPAPVGSKLERLRRHRENIRRCARELGIDIGAAGAGGGGSSSSTAVPAATPPARRTPPARHPAPTAVALARVDESDEVATAAASVAWATLEDRDSAFMCGSARAAETSSWHSSNVARLSTGPTRDDYVVADEVSRSQLKGSDSAHAWANSAQPDDVPQSRVREEPPSMTEDIYELLQHYDGGIGRASRSTPAQGRGPGRIAADDLGDSARSEHGWRSSLASNSVSSTTEGKNRCEGSPDGRGGRASNNLAGMHLVDAVGGDFPASPTSMVSVDDLGSTARSCSGNSTMACNPGARENSAMIWSPVAASSHIGLRPRSDAEQAFPQAPRAATAGTPPKVVAHLAPPSGVSSFGAGSPASSADADRSGIIGMPESARGNVPASPGADDLGFGSILERWRRRYDDFQRIASAGDATVQAPPSHGQGLPSDSPPLGGSRPHWPRQPNAAGRGAVADFSECEAVLEKIVQDLGLSGLAGGGSAVGGSSLQSAVSKKPLSAPFGATPPHPKLPTPTSSAASSAAGFFHASVVPPLPMASPWATTSPHSSQTEARPPPAESPVLARQHHGFDCSGGRDTAGEPRCAEFKGPVTPPGSAMFAISPEDGGIGPTGSAISRTSSRSHNDVCSSPGSASHRQLAAPSIAAISCTPAVEAREGRGSEISDNAALLARFQELEAEMKRLSLVAGLTPSSAVPANAHPPLSVDDRPAAPATIVATASPPASPALKQHVQPPSQPVSSPKQESRPAFDAATAAAPAEQLGSSLAFSALSSSLSSVFGGTLQGCAAGFVGQDAGVKATGGGDADSPAEVIGCLPAMEPTSVCDMGPGCTGGLLLATAGVVGASEKSQDIEKMETVSVNAKPVAIQSETGPAAAPAVVPSIPVPPVSPVSVTGSYVGTDVVRAPAPAPVEVEPMGVAGANLGVVGRCKSDCRGGAPGGVRGAGPLPPRPSSPNLPARAPPATDSKVIASSVPPVAAPQPAKQRQVPQWEASSLPPTWRTDQGRMAAERHWSIHQVVLDSPTPPAAPQAVRPWQPMWQASAPVPEPTPSAPWASDEAAPALTALLGSGSRSVRQADRRLASGAPPQGRAPAPFGAPVTVAAPAACAAAPGDENSRLLWAYEVYRKQQLELLRSEPPAV